MLEHSKDRPLSIWSKFADVNLKIETMYRRIIFSFESQFCTWGNIFKDFWRFLKIFCRFEGFKARLKDILTVWQVIISHGWSRMILDYALPWNANVSESKTYRIESYDHVFIFSQSPLRKKLLMFTISLIWSIPLQVKIHQSRGIK